MELTCFRLGQDIEGWWSTLSRPAEARLVLRWNGGAWYEMGSLAAAAPAFHYEPQLGARPEHSEDIEFRAMFDDKFHRTVGQLLARCGWSRPVVEPPMLSRLLALRSDPMSRVEFILDTNALSHGVGHWLAEIFADRCDLVTTSVSLRELQDLGDKCGYSTRQVEFLDFSKVKKSNKPMQPISVNKVGSKANSSEQSGLQELLESRGCFESARRFVEYLGLRRVVWRELDLDDTALMLSRGATKQGDKSSEADTMLLRQVRRSIQQRVRGINRFFVTGDIGLARRATTELPVGSVIAARVRPANTGSTYQPASWWPGTQHGNATTSGQTTRFIREWLSICDQVDLVAADGSGYRFTAWQQEQGPEDYISPWVRVEPVAGGWQQAQIPVNNSTPVEPPESFHNETSEADTPGVVIDAPAQPEPEVEGGPTPLKPPDWWLDVPPLDANLRVGATTLFRALFAIVSADSSPEHVIGDPKLIGDSASIRERRQHLARLLMHLHLGQLSDDGERVAVGSRAGRLRTAWCDNDHESLFWILAPYAPLREVSGIHTGTAPAAKATSASARTIAAHLGFVARIHGEFYPGGADPTVPEMHAAMLSELSRNDGVLGIESLYMLLLKEFKVSPSRIASNWDGLGLHGLFDNLTFSRGGDSSDAQSQTLTRFDHTGWAGAKLDLGRYERFRELSPAITQEGPG